MIDNRNNDDDKPDREPPPGWRVVKVWRVNGKHRVETYVDGRGRLVITELEPSNSN